MNFDFEQSMAKISDDELIQVLTTERNNYQETALAAAENEFKKRNISNEVFEKAKQHYEVVKLKQSIKANTPLELSLKIMIFLIPLPFMLFMAKTFNADGYERKANELHKWFFLGILFYLILFLVLRNI